jgi:uncharacterized protein YggE
MAKARTIADAAGLRLGRIIAVSEGVVARPLPAMRVEDVVSQLPQAFAATPVSAGEASVVVDVSVVYEIQ